MRMKTNFGNFLHMNSSVDDIEFVLLEQLVVVW